MSDLDPQHIKLDHALRQSMSAPAPRLSADFHQRLSRELRRRSRQHLFRRVLLASYSGVSALTSIAVMYGHGLDWEVITVMALVPLSLLGLARRLPAPELQTGKSA